MSDNSHIRQAILLVAGLGSRLRPLTDETPKCLLEVGGEPLLVRLLRQLASRGVEHAVLATGYLEPKIRACLSRYDDLPAVTLRNNPAFSKTNNAESLRLALPAVNDESFLLCDGDVLLRASGWLDEMLEAGGRNVLAMITPEQMGKEEMKIALADSNAPLEKRPVVGLSKELEPVESAGESIGVQTIASSFIGPLSARLEAMSTAERASAYYEDIFADLMGDEQVFYVHDVPVGCWTEIDTVDDLERARRLYGSWQHAHNE